MASCAQTSSTGTASTGTSSSSSVPPSSSSSLSPKEEAKRKVVGGYRFADDAYQGSLTLKEDGTYDLLINERSGSSRFAVDVDEEGEVTLTLTAVAAEMPDERAYAVFNPTGDPRYGVVGRDSYRLNGITVEIDATSGLASRLRFNVRWQSGGVTSDGSGSVGPVIRDASFAMVRS